MTSHQVKWINSCLKALAQASGSTEFLWRLLVKGDKVYRFKKRNTSVNALLIHKWRAKEWTILPRFPLYNSDADWFSRTNKYECFHFYLSQDYNLINFSIPTNSITTLTTYSLGLINIICSTFNLIGLSTISRWYLHYILPSVFCLCHQDSKILYVLVNKSICCKVGNLSYKLHNCLPGNLWTIATVKFSQVKSDVFFLNNTNKCPADPSMIMNVNWNFSFGFICCTLKIFSTWAIWLTRLLPWMLGNSIFLAQDFDSSQKDS